MGKFQCLHRKPSKSKLIAGEVKAVHLQHDQKLQRSHSHGNSMLAAHIEQRIAGEEAMFKKSLEQSKKVSLPSSQGLRNSTGKLSPPPVHTPSPTMSEYDTCDPWDDY